MRRKKGFSRGDPSPGVPVGVWYDGIRMHARAALVVLVLAASVPSARAASGFTLPDTGRVTDALDAAEADQALDAAAAAFGESDELFPESAAPPRTAIEEQRDDRTAGYLSIRVGAKDVVLRDVPVKEWFAPYVRDIAELQLVSGYRDADGVPTGAFGPADPVTLEQVAKVAVLAAGIDATSCALPPANATASGSWSASYVACAEQRGWAVFSDASADVRRPATREEVVMTVMQAFGRAFDVDTASIVFTDVEKTGAYAPAIAKASADGVVSGYADAEGEPTGAFGPRNDVTRAEFAKILSVSYRLYAE